MLSALSLGVFQPALEVSVMLVMGINGCERGFFKTIFDIWNSHPLPSILIVIDSLHGHEKHYLDGNNRI